MRRPKLTFLGFLIEAFLLGIFGVGLFYAAMGLAVLFQQVNNG